MSRDANAPRAADGERTGRPHLGHIRGLDGIRAIAVLALIAFHTGISWVPGGFYGVDAFFVLSGYLITSLLITEWEGTGSIRLRRFWAGRARRLLPALFVLVAVIGIVLAADPPLLATPHVISDALSTIFYASNWFSIHGGVSYFSTVAQPSPLLHTWSLAIEEQFYLVWPLVVLGILTLGTRPRSAARRAARRSKRQNRVRVLEGGFVTLIPRGALEPDPVFVRRRRLHLLFVVASFGALASALEMVLLAPNGYTTRAYYGTDTRAQALLVGAAIASGLALWRPQDWRWFKIFAGVVGVLGMAGTAYLWGVANQNSVFAFSGGFLMASLASGGVVLCAGVNRRGAPSVELLELAPVRWLGTISYGVYLWYWPVLLVMTPARIHWSVYPLFLARVAVTVSIASVSAYAIELPIRRGAFSAWRSWVAAPVGAAVAIGAVLASTLVPVGAVGVLGTGTLPTSPPTTTTTTTSTTASTGAGGTTPSSTSTTTTTVPAPSALSPAFATQGVGTRPVKVLLLGDSIAGSLGVGLSTYEGNDHVQIVNEGIPGCSLAMNQEIKVLFYTLPPGSPCDPNNPDNLMNTWKHWIDTYNPDVVVYVARGETFDDERNGSWTDIQDKSFQDYIESRFRQAVNVFGSKGAAVVLMTSPYYDSGLQPTGQIWPEDTPERVVLDNQTIRTVATSMTAGPDDKPVYVFNLNGLTSPDGKFTTDIGPVNLRCNDGVHFSRPGGVFIGLQLLPDLAALGQAHAASAPGGAWDGSLPPSTPSWYTKLPCQ